MAGTEKFIGFAVSIDCGDILGTYQGQVSAVNSQKQTLSIVRACRNGIPCKIPEITISSPDIQGLRILKSPKELEDERRKADAPSSERSSGASVTSSASSVSLHKRVHPLPVYPSPKDIPAYPLPRDIPAYPLPRDIPAYPPRDIPGYPTPRDIPGYPTPKDIPPPPYPVQPLDQTKRYAKEYQSDRRLTPKKGRNRNKSVSNDDCFSAPIESFDEEFDFEKNLAKFDKRAVWEEIENSLKPDVVRNADNKRTSRYLHDAGQQKSESGFYRHISVPGSHQGAREYVTESGIIVPSITEDLRRRIYGAAEQLGFTAERISESCGRGVTDLVLQLIGAKYWLNPVNANQRPSAVFLCCLQNYQSAWVVNAARHLANRNVNVKLVICHDQASSLPISSTVSQEISLYKSTSGRITMDVRDLTQIADDPVDIIINSVDCTTQHHSAPFYRAMVEFANRSKAPVLAVDPFPDLSPSKMDIKWSMCPILPLSMSEECGSVYACDLGFSKQLFTTVGVKYVSPFAHNFVMPLRVSK